MPALSERDLSGVEKFSNAMKAALGRQSRQVNLKDTDSQRILSSNPSASDITEMMLSERRLWAEAAVAFWRLASRQQIHLLSYVSTGALRELHRFCEGLLDHIRITFLSLAPTATPLQVLDCVSSLGTDHILFLLDTFCSPKGCISMEGGEETRGRELHMHVCRVLAEQDHLYWMTRVVRAFCDESWRVCSEKDEMSRASVSAIHGMLRCLLHCCATSAACAHALIYTEPRPLVAQLLYGLRLRISSSTLIRPVVRDDPTRLGVALSSTPSLPTPTMRLPATKSALAEYLTSGRTNAFDEISREALNVAVAAVKRVAAHETPEVVIGLCHIVDVSSRSIVPSPKDEKKPSISTQIAMYENVLMALEALFQLLQVKDDEPWSQELVLRQEIVLQQILNHDLARAVERLLRHCPTILDADSTLFQSIGTLCTPPFTSSRRRRRSSTVSRVENFTQCVPGNGDSLSGSMCSRNASMVSLTSSIHVSRPTLPEGSVARASNLARSLWMSVWPGASRGSGVAGLTHAHAASRPAPSDDEPIGSFFQRGTSDVIFDHAPSPTCLSLDFDGEEWWYSNKTYVDLLLSLTQLLNAMFSDATTPLSIRLSICKLLTQISMRSSSAFAASEGRLVMRSFLTTLRAHDQGLCTSPVEIHDVPHVEEEKNKKDISHEIHLETHEQLSEKYPCTSIEDDMMYAALAQKIVAGLWHVYHVLHMIPLSGETVDIIELPLLPLRWRGEVKEAEEEKAEEGATKSSGGVHKAVLSLFGPVVRVWYTALMSNDDEDLNKRSQEVFMEVLVRLLKLGGVPLTTMDFLRASTVSIPSTPPTTNFNWVASHSEDSSFASMEKDASRAEPSDTIKSMRSVFVILLQRDPGFLSFELLKVLFALLWANDAQLSELGRKCIASSLDFGEVYPTYAKVIGNADSSLLIQLLLIFSAGLVSSEVSMDAKHERRAWLFQHGCVNAVIAVLERVLRAPHDVQSFPSLIRQLFCFLSLSESAQGRGPKLEDTRLVHVFTESLHFLEGAEYLILITQSVLDAATSKYDQYRSHTRRVNTHGHFTLPIPNCSVEKPVFIDLVPPLLCYAHEHAMNVENDLLSALHLVLKMTTNVRSEALLKWALQRKHTALLPYLDLDAAVADRVLPYLGNRSDIESFWTPILQEAPERTELRFSCTGGIAVTLGRWPEKGFSVSAYFRFEEIYSDIQLFEFIDGEVLSPSLASIRIAGGDSVNIMHDGKRVPVNEGHALPDLEPQRWAHFIVVMSMAHTVSVYLNADKVGTCSLPYFRSHSEVVMNIGFVNTTVHDSLFSIGEVVLWDEELTTPQVEAYVATTGYKPNVCKILECEIPRELSETHEKLPIEDRIAVFSPYETRDSMLVDVLQKESRGYPIVAKLTGTYAEAPKNWIDYRTLFLNRGGLVYMLEWIAESTSAEELERYMALTCNCIRGTTSGGTMDVQTYALLDFHLRRLAHLITPAVCDSLLHLATAKMSVNDEFHPFIINRLVFDHIFRDIELFADMPLDAALYLIEGVERLFTVASCRFARRNAYYIIPFRFVDSVLNGLVYANVSLPFVLRARVISCLKHIMIATDFEPNIVHVIASTAAVLTPVEVEVTSRHQTALRVKIPKARFSQISVTLYGAFETTCLILRSLVECCCNGTFAAAFGIIVDLNWYAACVSRFADVACVVYATRLFFEAMRFNMDLRNEVMHHPAVIVHTLSPHCLNEDLLLLLLSLSVGAVKRIDVLSSKHPMLQQLVGILDSMTPELDAVVLPIFSKLLTLYLTAASSTPACFRPSDISSAMQRRLYCSYRLHKYFSLARVCSILMLQIYARRLLPQAKKTGHSVSVSTGGRSIPFSLKKDASKEDMTVGNKKTPVQFGRYHRAFAALRVCLYLWKAIQRRRYRRVRQQNVSGHTPLMVSDVEPEKALFILRTLQSLPLKPGLFVPCTLSPYQIEVLAFFGTFLKREAVSARFEEKLRLHEGDDLPFIASTTSLHRLITETTAGSDFFPPHVKISDESHLLPVLHDTVTEEETKHDDDADGDDDSTVEEKEQGGQWQHGVHQQNKWDEREEKFRAKSEKYFENQLHMPSTASAPRELHVRQTSSCTPNSFLHGDGDVPKSPPLAATPVSTEVASLPEDGDARAASGSGSRMDQMTDAASSSEEDRHLSSGLDQLFLPVEEATLRSEMGGSMSADVSMGSFAPFANLQSFNAKSLQECAVGVLCNTVLASLLNLPVTEGWVGGQTYGSCGALLFQLILITGAMCSTEEVTLTLTQFFIDQLLVCVDLSERFVEPNTSVVSSLKGTGFENSARSFTSLPGSVSDVFIFNICRLNDLLVQFISFDVMRLSSLSPYFVWLLGWASSSWPQRSQQQLRSQIVKSCIAVLNKPSPNGVTHEQMEIVYMLLQRVLCRQWIMKDMLECLLRVLFRVYASLPPTSINEAEEARRKKLVILTLRLLMRTYEGCKELRKALSASALRQRISLYKEFAATLLIEDEAISVVAFETYCKENMTTIHSFISGRPKTKTDMAYKSMLKERCEYVKRINTFKEAYSKTINIRDKYRPAELVQAYTARFSSCVDPISPLKVSQLHWLVKQQCSLQQNDPRVRVLNYLDLRGNYTTVISNHVSKDAASTVLGTDNCEQQHNHISTLVQPFAICCRPYILHTGTPFVDISCCVTPSALSLLRYLLEPNEVLRFISNGFRIHGIHATPCLILLTDSSLKLIGFSRITVEGDIILCQRENDEREEPVLPVHISTTKSSKNKWGSQFTASSFAVSMTNKLQRFLTDGGGKKRRRIETEKLHDGTKIAHSVRQASGDSYRDLFWVYFLQNIRSVRMAYYMHQDTAILFELMYDDGPMLSLVDAHQSMNTSARDKFLAVLKDVLGTKRCEFFDHSQRTASIRSMLIRWAAGSVSTYDYITFLNSVAGRTRRDFNQYPIYPWVLADYKSSELDMDSPKTYRDLSLPMGAQTEERRQKVMQVYQQMVEVQKADPDFEGVQPFHHGTHYSTSGGVLHFLIRVEPFTTFARIFQGGEFDVATRLFDSIDASFQSCVHGPTDCKELMPEFFFDGMFLLNANHCEFGEKSDGTVVNDVKLPPWAKGSTQVFISVMRYALESNFVLQNIHRWIDLIFAVRRRGKLAVESYNVFQRMTYGEEVLQALKKCDNPHDIDVIIAEVDNFGQTPIQLFQERHPAQRELKPCHPMLSTGGTGGAHCTTGGNVLCSGNTYTTAFQEQLPKVLSMVMHALDSPQTWYTLEDPAPGSFQAMPKSVSDAFQIHESPVLDFVTTRSGVNMCCYKYSLPVDDTDHVICWSHSEHMLMRFDNTRGHFLSSVRCKSVLRIPASVSAFCVSCRETLILIGSNSGTVYCFSHSRTDGVLVLSSTLCNHTNPIAGFALSTKYGRIISFTTSGIDCPTVWCVQHCHTVKLHALDLSRLLPLATPGDLIVVAAAIDPISANAIVVTRRHLLLFDRNGEPYGVGPLPNADKTAPHLEDEAGQVGFAVDDSKNFIASMTAVTTYETLEWASGIQLLITGHQDGSLSLWRVVRLPPERMEHGRIVLVEHHGFLFTGSQTPRLGAITALRQERPDVPVFFVGYHSGAVKVLRFENRTADMTKMATS
ncbi:hypothetical protein ECC02_007013 [Trypanosoma cruzi]|uniref:BEACH domain-containing protein n=1 Tax=Trypanosoma cruzi TaxID=5693 RepID=A0A7J6XZQ6_TRYCR|nr:hypothetical protein ECC02_007013 [Trypanosoma cruzi]